MQRKTLIQLFLALSFFWATQAYSGIISDTSNGTFIDETTNLEWIDFGSTAGRSHNDIVDSLAPGGEFHGWSLPTYLEAETLFINAFKDIPGMVWTTGTFPILQSEKEIVGDISILNDLFLTMGFTREILDSGSFVRLKTGHGWIYDSDSGKGYSFQYSDWGALYENELDNAKLFEYSSFSFSTSTPVSGAMLVRKVIQVPEPSSFIILAIVFWGLISIKQNRAIVR